MQNTSLDHVAHQLANKDACGRTIDYMRIAITDRCNYRCVYCMPASGVPDKGHCEIMSFEEIERFVSIAAGYGIRHLRLTGGEPLLRPDIWDIAAYARDAGAYPVIGTNATLMLMIQLRQTGAHLSASGTRSCNNN